MSEYHIQTTKYKDPECLVQALAEQGYDKVEVHEVAKPLVDYTGKQTHYTDVSGDKANIIVRRKYVGGAANDVGFVKTQDGTYAAVISEYDSCKHNKQWFNGLTRAYAEKTDMKAAKRNGLTFLGRKMVNGRVQLQFMDSRR